MRQTSDSGDLAPDRAHDLLEPLAILAALDRLDVRADQLDAVRSSTPRLVQRDREVEFFVKAAKRYRRPRPLASAHPR